MVAILSIGTELTTGQILNKNTQWLATELLTQGIVVSYQITVPDDSQLIKESLHFLTQRVSMIFITGGLGPTADDFTRKVLADTFERPLQWNEENWQKVRGKLSAKGVTIRDLHRQQCEFPEDAEILPNSAGIADGFTFNSGSVQIYALPGPPKELSAIWEASIRPRLAQLAPEPLRWVQLMWTTTGLPESEVAAKINQALGEHSSKVLYRVHTPCVDVKLLFQKKEAPVYEKLGQQIESALSPWLRPTSENQ